MAITTTPAYPLAGRVLRALVAQQFGGNYFRAFLTAAPPDSSLRAQLERAASTQLLIAEGPIGVPFEFTPDRGGVYRFEVIEITRGFATGGAYQGDPKALQTETVVGTTSSVALTVGQFVDSPIGINPYGLATVRLAVFGDHVRPTTLTVHGQKTPALILPTTRRAAYAAESITVLAKLAEFSDETAADIFGNLGDLLRNMRTKLLAHFGDIGGAFHNGVTDDTGIAQVETIDTNPTTPEAVARAAQILRARLVRHMTNEDGETIFHGSDTQKPDHANLPVTTGGNAGRLAEVITTIADCWRAYEAHRANTTPHPIVADTINVLTVALPPLFELHRLFVDALRSGSPTPPTTANSGVVLLVHSAGFSEV